MDTRKITNQLNESQYDEEFKGFTLGKGFVPNRYIAEDKDHAFKLFDSEHPHGFCGYEVDRRPGHRTLMRANEDEIIKAFMDTAHAPSKRKKIGREPSYIESFMRNREDKLVSIEIGEVMEKKPCKVQVTFNYSDGHSEYNLFGEREVEEIKNKYFTYVKQKEEVQHESHLESTTAQNAEFDLDEKYMVLSSKWKPSR